jgi:hypothetical protein
MRQENGKRQEKEKKRQEKKKDKKTKNKIEKLLCQSQRHYSVEII